MASLDRVHASWASTYRVRTGEAGLQSLHRHGTRCISSFSYNAGASMCLLRDACENNRQHCSSGPTRAVTQAAVSKQRKKAKDKKRTSPGTPQWKFEELMLVWDDIFEKACGNATVATVLYNVSRNGFSQYGQGCVLMEESVHTKPRGASSGFSFKSRQSPSGHPELPVYSSVQWNAKYVPKDFILDPSKAPESPSVPEDSTHEDFVGVVGKEKLISVLKGMERTRLLGLLAGSGSENAEAKDAGGEKPYDPAKDEMVVVLSVSVDGQQAVGADVLKAYPTLDDGISSTGETLWTLVLRDGLPL